MNTDSTATSPRRFDPILFAIVVISAVGGGLMLYKAKNWALMSDELLYTSMGRSIAQTIFPFARVRGESIQVFQVLYPGLIAPLVGPIRMPNAYPWVAVLNAVFIALAAIPAYLLTSFATGSRAGARWVALCTVSTPWLIFGSKVLPDSAAYLIVLWALYAIVRTASAREHVIRGDLLTLLAIVAAYYVRTQFLLLLGVWVGTIVLSCAATAFAEGGIRQVPGALIRLPLKRPIPLVVFVVVALLYVFDPLVLLGFYAPTAGAGAGTGQQTDDAGILTELLDHSSVLALGAGALPIIFAVPWLVTAVTRVKSRRQNDAAFMCVLALGAILYVGANFDMRFDPTDRVIERYIFYAAPLLFVAMAGFFAAPPKKWWAFALPAIVGLLVINATQPYGLDTVLNVNINFGFSPTQITLIAWQKFADAAFTSIFGLAIVISLIAGGFSWLAIVKGRAGLARDACFTLTALILIASTLYTVPKLIETQNSIALKTFGVRTNDQKRWVDRATGGQPVALVYSKQLTVTAAGSSHSIFRRPNSPPHRWRDVVFWNSSISTVYLPYKLTPATIPPIPGAAHRLSLDRSTGRIARVANDTSSYLLLSAGDPNFAPFTNEPPRREQGFVLYKTGRDAIAAWATDGLTLGGWVPRDRPATLRLFAPPGAAGLTREKIALRIDTTARHGDLKGFHVSGASHVKVTKDASYRTTFTWTASVPAGGHVDLRLVRGESPAHVSRLLVSAD
ncbi:MAG: hypothetical protein QM648_05965 [Solirubrobacterales bacterium]